MRRALVVSYVVLSATTVQAQTTAAADPMRCWWRTSAGAVAIGETFEATLTCAVREQEATRTVPDESRLAAATVQLAPFEVLGGSHPSDLRSATHRFLQYHYSLRVIDRDVIGRDARFPDLQIGYRVHTRVNGDWVEGRDRTYVMPGQTVRILSTVPLEADDIRDSANAGFAVVNALQFRTRALEIAALALVVLGVLVALPAVVRVVRGDSPAAVAAKGPSRRSVIVAAEGELSAVASESRGGWTPDLAARALHAVRLLAAVALDRAARPREVAEPTAAGHIVVSRGLIRRRRFVVSSAVTAVDVENAIAALPLTAPHERRHSLDQLLLALTTFTQRVYGASFDAIDARLDEAVGAAIAAAKHLRQRR